MIWDLPNLLVCLTLVLIAYLLGKIKLAHAIALALISFVPLLLNDVLFSPNYMPDQFTYLRMLSSIREFNYDPNYYNSRVTEASVLYALLPLPFVETVNSLGFFNKFLMIAIFIWVSSVLKLRGWILWFLLLYPSLILYSSLGLRDMLICTFMLLSLWLVIRGNYWLALICIAILVQIKMQNALLVALFSVGYIAAHIKSFEFSKKKFIALMLAFFALSYAIFPYIVGKIEWYRSRMYLEDGGLLSDYQPVSGFFDFLYVGSLGILRTLFLPLPWAVNSAFQFIQSIENIFIAGLLVVFTWSSYKIIPKQTLFWLFFLLASMFMYGLIVANVGTVVRYKLPFIVVYIIFLSYERVRYSQTLILSPALSP